MCSAQENILLLDAVGRPGLDRTGSTLQQEMRRSIVRVARGEDPANTWDASGLRVGLALLLYVAGS
jgi:hypothetical protein